MNLICRYNIGKKKFRRINGKSQKKVKKILIIVIVYVINTIFVVRVSFTATKVTVLNLILEFKQRLSECINQT